MATWITHLRIAEKLLQPLAIRDPAYFYLGSVAPDAGKLNDDKRTYTPSSDVSHFTDKTLGKWRSCDEKFYRRYLSSTKDPQYDSFCLGYYLHILTDTLWSHFVHRPTKAKHRDKFVDPQFVWVVKEDWYNLDFDFLQANGNWEPWKTFLAVNYERDYLDFYPATNIAEKVAYIKRFYTEETGTGKPKEYLDENNLSAFIAETCRILIGGMRLRAGPVVIENTLFEVLEGQPENAVLRHDHLWIGNLHEILAERRPGSH